MLTVNGLTSFLQPRPRTCFFSDSGSSFHWRPSSAVTSVTFMLGFSDLTVSRMSWQKNMYADRPRLGALGSFFFCEV